MLSEQQQIYKVTDKDTNFPSTDNLKRFNFPAHHTLKTLLIIGYYWRGPFY
ncbi:MAG: hypothetical protein OFPI_25190 [Osedax symbiont Rs2]|nr:MAG: hypothetical protein OFPI_25190 [Osedax symbiont Rs2]